VTVVRPSPAPWDAFAALLSACMWLFDGGEEAETEIDGQQPWWLWRLVWRDC
jgi:hypothetical protein